MTDDSQAPIQRTKGDQEFDKQRGEVKVEIVELMTEYGFDVVAAVCADIAARQLRETARESIKEEYDC